MAAGRAGAALEAAAVETAVAVDAVVAAEGGSADRRAFRVSRARPAESDVAAAKAAANRLTDTSRTIESATALAASGAAAALVAAAVEGTVAGNPIVVAEDRSSDLAAFTRMGALPPEPDRAAATARGSADSVRAEEAAAADDVARARAAVVVAAVQDSVGIESVRCADCRPRCLAALSGLRTFRAERQPARSVVRAETIHAVEATATSSAIVACRTGTAFIAAAVQWTVAVIAIISADRRSAGLTTLFGRRALRSRSQSTRCRRSRRCATTGAIYAEEVGAALHVVCTCAA